MGATAGPARRVQGTPSISVQAEEQPLIRRLAALVLASLVAACTALPDLTPGPSVPSPQSQGPECKAVIDEANKIGNRVKEITTAAYAPAAAKPTGTSGVTVTWPAQLYIGGTAEQKAEIQSLTARMTALEESSRAQNCGILFKKQAVVVFLTVYDPTNPPKLFGR